MNVYDHYYDKVDTVELSKPELLKILNQLSKINSFGNNKHTAFELFYRMSKQQSVDDELIKTLVVTNLESSGGFNNDSYKIQNNGSKALFDDMWANGAGKYETLRFWRCKHADAKQLEEIHAEYFTKKDRDSGLKSWYETQREDLLKHPNISDKILSRAGYLKNIEMLVMMASNPDITSKKTAFEQIASTIKATDGSFYNKHHEALAVALLENDKLNWMIVAKAIELPKRLGAIFSDIALPVTKGRKNAFLKFCKHKDCPDNIKSYIYEKTQDEEFLPQAAREIFLF